MSSLRDQKKVEKLQKKIYKIESKNGNFWSNGINEKEYLLIISTTMFFAFVATGLIMLLLGKEIDEMYLSLLDMVSPVVMLIVGSVFAVTGVQAFTNRKSSSVEINRSQNTNQMQNQPSNHTNFETQTQSTDINNDSYL